MEKENYVPYKGGNVTTDSRKISEGQIFFALKGENFDGSQFAVSAIKQGASCAVVNKDSDLGQCILSGQFDELVEDESSKIILVDDTLQALRLYAAEHRNNFDIPIIALTGTNGKTTTKELIRAVLSTKYNVAATEGNLNNNIGVPLTLFSINEKTEIAVIEMGASHPGDIKVNVDLVRPTHGLITNVGIAHIQGFKSFDGVKKTKGELYDYLDTNEGISFINADNEDLIMMAKERNNITQIFYGQKYQNVIIEEVTEEHPYLRMKVKEPIESTSMSMFKSKKEYSIDSHLIGTYNADNILAALAVGKAFGISYKASVKAINNYKPSNHRSELRKTEKNLLVIDAYNANPSSMALSIENFANTNFKNKTLILGDMRELGDDSIQEHIKILNQIARLSIDGIFCIGEEFVAAFEKMKKDKFENNKEKNTKERYQEDSAIARLSNTVFFLKDVDKMLDALTKTPLLNKTILLKGSNSIHLDKLFPEL